jgi:hypothetical protein
LQGKENFAIDQKNQKQRRNKCHNSEKYNGELSGENTHPRRTNDHDGNEMKRRL